MEVFSWALFDRNGRYSFSWTSESYFKDEKPYIRNKYFWSSDGATDWNMERDYRGKSRVSRMSLREASAASTGVSQVTSHEIFRLLSNGVGGFRLDQLSGLHVVRSEAVYGVDSYVMRGYYVDDSSQDLWIGKQDHLIRKGVYTYQDGTTTTTERTGIGVNSKIQDSEFGKCAP